ncbi:MAG: PAS domain-containing protein [Chloroflexota bacterium]
MDVAQAPWGEPDLRAALDALRETEGRFRAAFEENPETIGIFRPIPDAGGGFTDVEILYENRIGRERYFGGRTLEDLEGRPLFADFPQWRPLLYELFAAFLERGERAHEVLHGERADGEFWSETFLFRFEGGFVHCGRDITAAVRAQRGGDELASTGQRIIDAMLDPVTIAEPILDEQGEVTDFRVIYANAAAIQRERFPERTVGGRLAEWWPSAAATGLLAVFRTVLETGEPFVRDAMPISDPGRPQLGQRFVDLRITREGGTLVGSWRDVTERERMRVELEATQRRFEQVVAGIPIGVYRARTSADGHARWEYVSGPCSRILGIPAETLLADPRQLFEAIHPDDRARLVAGNARAHREGSPMALELRIRRDAAWRVIRFVNEPADTNGEERVWHGFAEDITEQRAVAAALAESEERYRLVSEQAIDVIWTMRPDGTLLSITPSVERAVGITVEQAIGRPLPEFVAPGSLPVAAAYLRSVAEDLAAGRTPGSFLGDMEMLHVSGGTSWYETRVIPRLDPDGRLTEFLGVSRDITERKRLEETQRRFSDELERRVAERTRELEAANEELRSFTYSVSHDLRAPVRAVAGFARILERDYGAGLDDAGRHKLANIVTAGETMGRLIDDLLAYSRIGQARVEPVPVEPIVERLRVAFSEPLAQVGGSLELVGPAAVPLADPALLERILLNLVDNAIAYRRLDVAPRIVVRAAPVADGRVRVSVADNGRGIPLEARERVFEVFTRLDPEPESTRSGIGLATVRKAVRAMGAEVELDSEVGAGTTIAFLLRAAPPH